MTLSEFSDVFALLAVQLRATDADEATIRSYYQALQDLEIELVAEAAKRLAQSAEWFPKTSEWRLMVERIWAERVQEQRALLRNAAGPLCVVCDDTGWARKATVEKGRPVTRVERCACADRRYAELLGRVPMPRLLPASVVDPTQYEQAMKMVQTAVKPMPAPTRTRRPLVTPAFEQAAADDPILAAELERRRRSKVEA